METVNKLLELFKDSQMKNGKVYLPDFSRNDLAKLFSDLNLNKGAEIGVESGEYSEVLLEANPNLILSSVDAWETHRNYRDHTSQKKLDGFYFNTQKRLHRFGERTDIVKEYSMKAVHEYRDRSLDFVYIDANHKFVEFTNDLFWWGKKVKTGGIVAGHDYTKYPNIEVEIHIPYVLDGFLPAYHIAPLFIIGENVDKVKSWFFVQTLE